MVKKPLLFTALILWLTVAAFANTASAWTGVFFIEQESAKIWINQDGSIELFYNITVKLDSGDNVNYVRVGQPHEPSAIGIAKDQYGHYLAASSDSSGSDYKIRVTLFTPLKAGQTIWFTLSTMVDRMIYEDETNPGNVGMQFIPTWWQTSVRDLRVSIVLPPNVTKQMVKTYKVNWTNTGNEDDGRLWVYWGKQNLSPDEQYPVGVSFPKEYVQTYYPAPSDGGQPSPFNPPSVGPYAPAFFVVVVLAFLSIIIAGAVVIGRKIYSAPRIGMETLGIKRGLTAVEASYLLDMKPTRLVTEILYSLLQKRAVWVEDTKPSIRLRIMPKLQGSFERKDLLRYYETDFVNSIEPDGTLEEEKLAQTVMKLRNAVEAKMRGYCRRDTVDYYRKIVEKAWQQVEQAGAPDLASKAYDEQLLWLLLDPNCKSRTQTAFRDRVFEPSPLWLWYWYGYQHYNPHPAYTPNVETPTQTAKAPTIPGAEFANNIATSVENTANNIVVNLEKFANAILPMPAEAKARNQPAHQGATCVCACHACACACACVSCACACASGGVG